MRSLLVRATVALYRVALLRYPRKLRRRWGRQMVEDARTLTRTGLKRRGLALGLFVTWRRLAVDLLRPLPTVRRTSQAGGREGRGRRRVEDGEAVMGWGRATGGGGGFLDGLREDGLFAWRSLRRDPRFSLLMVGVLGVGLALNVAVFSVVRAYLLRPLPYPDASRVVQVRGGQGLSWQDAGQVLEAPTSWDLDVFVMVGEGRPELVRGSWVTPGFQELYGVRPVLGRGLEPRDARPGRAPVALISHDLWQRRFGGSPDVLGRTFRAFTSDRPDHAETFRVVGVLPPDFWHVNAYTEVLAPLGEDRALYAGRLPAGIPPERAARALEEVARATVADLPDRLRIELRPLQDVYTEAVRPTLLSLQATALLVLLIAGANGAVLLLVRAARRGRELGVRQALGAPRLRLWRQLLGEGFLLAGAAGALGVGLAALLLDTFGALVETTLLSAAAPGGPGALAPDLPVLAAALGLTALVGFLFGAVPVAVALRGEGALGVLGGARGGGEPRRRLLARRVMVAAEVGLSVALLGGAALMVRSSMHLNTLELGFEPRAVVGGQIGLRQASYPEAADRARFFTAVLDGVRGLPEVEAAALLGSAPYGGRPTPRRVEAEPDGDGAGVTARVAASAVSDGLPGTLGVRVVQGRDFAPSDEAGAEPVVLVTRSLARRLWSGERAVGRRLRLLDPLPGAETDTLAWRTVVGVVEDLAHVPGSEVEGDVFLPYRQSTGSWIELVVRTRAGLTATLGRVEEVLAGLDPEVPLSRPYRLEDRVDRARAPTEVLAWLLGGFSFFAGLLAVVGLYGVISYAARQRRRSVAIRMALGADRGRVRRIFLREGVTVVLAGLAAGIPLAVLLGRLLGAQLHGVSPSDPLTHGGVAVLLFLTGSVAVWLPARRASVAEPMVVLREE